MFNQAYRRKSLHNGSCRQAINSYCKPFGPNNDGVHLTFKHLERVWSEGFSFLLNSSWWGHNSGVMAPSPMFCDWWTLFRSSSGLNGHVSVQIALKSFWKRPNVLWTAAKPQQVSRSARPLQDGTLDKYCELRLRLTASDFCSNRMRWHSSLCRCTTPIPRSFTSYIRRNRCEPLRVFRDGKGENAFHASFVVNISLYTILAQNHRLLCACSKLCQDIMLHKYHTYLFLLLPSSYLKSAQYQLIIVNAFMKHSSSVLKT